MHACLVRAISLVSRKIATTLDELEQRLVELEREFTRLPQRVGSMVEQESPVTRGARLLGEARASQQAISKAAAEAFGEMALKNRPIGIENLREMLSAPGVQGADNAFSREILMMRDE
jgi:regulator of replication initiation timing